MAIKGFFENPVFLSVITSWFSAQLIKTVIYLLRSKVKNPHDTFGILMWRTGGMPSSHSATVASMSASTGLFEGPDSTLFIITLMLALIIIRDALGVRRSSGIQARVLNKLGRQSAEKLNIEYYPVKEVPGHTPLEVAIGVFLGIIIAFAFHYL